MLLVLLCPLLPQQWRTVLKDLGQYSIGNTLNACTWGAISIASVDVSPLVDVNCVTKRSSCGLTADAMQVGGALMPSYRDAA